MLLFVFLDFALRLVGIVALRGGLIEGKINGKKNEIRKTELKST